MVLVAGVVLFFGIIVSLSLLNSESPAELERVEELEEVSSLDYEGSQAEFDEDGKMPLEADIHGELPGDPKLVQDQFAKHLLELEKCLQIKVGETQISPTAQNLVKTLATAFGEPVTTNEDWSNTILIDKEGREKRIRLEVEAIDESKTQRVMAIFIVDEEGIPQKLDIPLEHSITPSEALIASYQSDGDVKVREFGWRLEYNTPVDVFLIQRNDALTDLEISQEDKSFNCRSLHSANSSCQCIK